MISDPNSSSQAQVLETYTVLHTLKAAWQGSLVLNEGFDARGAAVSLASSVAGAVCLTLERDVELLRAGLRRGACDFVVNTLDEALRTIKNEIRKGLPLSVGLAAVPEHALAEILERGVAPQLLCGFDAYPEQMATLEGWGALRLSGGFRQQSEGAIAEHGWSLRAFAFANSAALREFDGRVLALLTPGDELRRRWISAAARLFPRERGRAIWATDDEFARLALPATEGE